MGTEYDSLFIGGQWRRPSSRQTITAVSASTEAAIGSVPEAVEADIDAAVDAARAAFDEPTGWAQWEPSRRAAAMRRLADALDARASEMARRVSAQIGTPIAFATELDAVLPSLLLRYYASVVHGMALLEAPRPHLLGGTTVIRMEPIGVVATIVPWTFPQILAAGQYAPALAAGCTVVLKPPREAALDASLLADAVDEAGLPPGVLNIVPGGPEVGACLVAHPEVNKVAFIGSTPVGREIAATCGRLLRPVTLSLGGKSAAIMLDDVELDLEVLGERLFNATLLNNGQTCFLSTRILAPRHRYAEVVDLFAALADSLTVGDALYPDTQIGPLASERQRDRVEGFIEKGRSEGARLVAGGGRPAGFCRGWFVEPTVFADVDNNHTIAQKEIFGPVLSVIPYTDEDEAVRLANDSDFGLAGSVWTGDDERGLRFARRVRTGTIGINGYSPDPGAPFGGVKASGLGRALGPEAIGNFQQFKSIYC